MKVAYIDQHKEKFGVQPICEALKDTASEIAPSTYYAAASRPPSARTLRDEELTEEITMIHADNYSVYGARKIHARAPKTRPHGGPLHRWNASCAPPACAG